MSTEQKLLAAFPDADGIPEEYRTIIPKEYPRYLIDGELHEWDGEMQDIYSPISINDNGELNPLLIGRCPVLDAEAGLRALKAAAAAYDNGMGRWPTMSVADRIRHLEDFASRLKDVRDEVVRLMTLEICKPRIQSEVEFDRTVEYIDNTINALKDLDRSCSRMVIESGIYAQIRRAPLGPVLCMGPYNYPFNETFATLIPALIMGNTAIVKTPRMGKLLLSPIIEALRDSFPRGVVNVLFGDRRVVQPILETGGVNVLAFIGSSGAADALRLLHPHPHRLRCVLGLDAKNPAFVLETADMELTAKEILSGSLSFSGQRCTAIKIVFVHRSRAEELLTRLDEGIAGLKVGMPFDQGVDITPMPGKGKIEYLKELVDDAVAKGARIVNAGGGATAGTLFHPALLYDVKPDMRVYQEEQFGPIVPVVPFDDEREPLEYQVSSNYGQQMSIFGSDPDQVARFIDPMVNQVCRVNINSQCQRGPDTFPFTGRKDSAEGTLSVSDALRCFSIRTLVAAKGTDGNKELISRILRQRSSNFLTTDYIL
ncbi:NADP-dependent glyceraldehyde-3-phosphate dehydrogenase [Pseudodesulfovibrio sp.]|uniref:NADP-dependent glyceraldehyde-3-phosphate dehydrogenase n=1 Tax=unclassified Pseudodesulfovibrio TaxID=2661612 RepID=UPI003AFF708C